ncbi:dUTP diphosphatase [Brevibacillus fulvus]|uniref:dUTP diphosphatase n=1 Tax=Brevibacillus fulvus TaxID=1125967 RepID=A0A938Y2Z7_9BACL|nr:dUTP diphosphatase [Brevibacillus fulvus]MBM7592213.1 dUTP pyrophosphatase [Brevibacillus fulvus]
MIDAEAEKMKQIPVKVKKLHPDAVIPQYAKPGDAGFDLVAIEDVIIAPGETVKVPTGLAFAIPEGYELQVRPRSGISAKTKLRVSNAPGTIDSSYRGEVCVLIDNVAPIPYRHLTCVRRIDGAVHSVDIKRPEGSYIIRKGDRIAQGVICEVPVAQFEEVDGLDETERGIGGFGSSGVRA